VPATAPFDDVAVALSLARTQGRADCNREGGHSPVNGRRRLIYVECHAGSGGGVVRGVGRREGRRKRLRPGGEHRAPDGRIGEGPESVELALSCVPSSAVS